MQRINERVANPAKSFRRFKFWLCVLFVVCIALITFRPLRAESKDLDVVLLIDVSGSMLVTDPGNLRLQGVELFLKLLGANDRVSLITFDEKPRVVIPLSEGQDRNRYSEELKKLQNKGEYTDIGLAIKVAQEHFDQESREQAEKIIVLLSDGRFEPHPSRGEVSSLVSTLLDDSIPAVLTKGIRIFTLAFSLEADRDLLEKIANKAGGLFWYTPNSEKIHESFADLLLSSKKPQIATVSERGFYIDELVEEATFYVTKEAGSQLTIVAPDDRRYYGMGDNSNIKWYRGKNFEVVTLNDPEAGSWKIIGANIKDGYATLLTKLSLDADWPTHVLAEEPTLLQANLQEGSKPLALASMSVLLEMKFKIFSTDKISEPLIEATLRDDGQHGDVEAQDGIYSAYVALPDPGRYKLKVIAHSPTFDREQIIPFEVEEPYINLEVIEGAEFSKGSDHHDGHKEHSKEHHSEHTSKENLSGSFYFVATLTLPKNFKNPEVLLFARKDKKKIKIPLQKAKNEDIYFASSDLLEGGSYKLQAELIGKVKGRGKVHQKSSQVNFTKEKVIEVAQHEEKEETKKEEQPPPVEESAIVVPIILMSLLNLISFGAGWFWLRLRNKSSSSSTVSDEVVPARVLDMLESIQNLAEESKVDFLDSSFKIAKALDESEIESLLVSAGSGDQVELEKSDEEVARLGVSDIESELED
jgi:hypothetical protein